MAANAALLIPMNVDCFVMNESVCEPATKTSSKIAPIVQPNYTFLRFDSEYISDDIQRSTDLHGTGKPDSNSRITDLGSGERLQGRIGVYVHWMIPRPYRAGTASTDGQVGRKKDRGQLSPTTPEAEGQEKKTNSTDPQFLDVPTRWLVIRHTDLSTVQPREAVDKGLISELEAWVVESDHRQSIDDLDEGVDLQVDVSPYISSQFRDENGNTINEVNIQRQAEVFIGSKWQASTWSETDRDRVTINLAHSSNQLFADYQPHNSNVFSIIDTLTYTEESKTKRVQSAKVSYSVLGWHSTDENDIFFIDPHPDRKVTRHVRLDALGMILPKHAEADNDNWGKLDTPSRVLCHGTKYDVQWSFSSKPTTPADDACAKLMARPAPISIGTDPLDSIIALVNGFESNQSDDIVKLLKQLHNILALLLARDEGVESQRQARSKISQASFNIHDGGKRFYFADSEDSSDQITSPAGTSAKQRKPSDTDIDLIRELNKSRLWTDNAVRLQESLRWEMFRTWWSFVYDLGRIEDIASVRLRVGTLRDKLNSLTDLIEKGEEKSDKAKTLSGVQFGVQDPYFRPSDPTVMLASVPSAWPYDYLDKLAVRLDTQTLAQPATSRVPQVLEKPWQTFADHDLKNAIPESLYTASLRLFEEFSILRPERPPVADDKKSQTPLYHDNCLLPSGKPDPQRWRDRWNAAQPFFPLFLEWEVEYVHIPFRFWKLKDFTTDPNQESRVRYVIDEEAFQKDTSKDKTEGRRLLSGRTLLLPQPGFSLEAKIQSLFASLPAPPANGTGESSEEDIRQAMVKQLRQLPLVSSPLTGFTDHLITRLHGTHVKPNNKTAAGVITAIPAAVAAARRAGFDADDVKSIQSESGLTPYTSMVQYDDDHFPVFKPVAHGQFRFTQLNVIDKFGQAIHALDPTVISSNKSVYPCTSEYMAPQRLFSLDGSQPPASDPNAYDYIQIPPQINQFSRLNASFVQLSLVDPQRKALYWRPTTEWENPVWGWVVINYANYGLQFFLSDGTFYREVRVGGPRGTLASPEWLPFKPAAEDLMQDPKVLQLQKLIAKLSESAVYLRAFTEMIDASMATLLPAPTAYAEHMSAVVGRPLALVNTGWSLELATQPYTTSAIGGSRSEPKVLASDPTKPNQDDQYTFEVQFGSREKAYDGLIGFFPAKEQPSEGDALDLDHLYTFYHRDHPSPPAPSESSEVKTSSPIKRIEDEPRKRLRPFHFDPLKYKSEKSLYIDRCGQQYVFGAILDPFAAVHAFTSLLPPKELHLPPRIWQEAFAKMTTFFTIGPLLLQKDIPDENDAGQVSVGETVPGLEAEKELKLGVPVPATTLGEWAWLQPYFTPTAADASEGSTNYTRLKLEKVDERTRFEEAPYTVIEGHLQLRKPLGGTHA